MRRRVVATMAVAVVGAVSLAACGTTAPLKERLELQAVADGAGAGVAGQPVAGATDGSGGSDAAGAPVVISTNAAGDVVTSAPTAGDAPAANAGDPGATTGSAPVTGATGAAGGVPTSGAGGGSGKTSTTKPGTTAKPTAAATSTAKAATGPIQLGFLSTDTSNSSSLGLNSGSTVSNTAIINAGVAAMNAQGGVGGHQIKAVIATTDTGGANWANEFQAACSAFTEDNHVTAVLGYDFVSLNSFEQCLATQKIPHLSEGYEVGDNTTLATYPGLFSLAAPSVNRIELLNLAGAVASGELTTKNKLGIMYGTCNGEDTAFTQTVQPYIAKMHLDLASTVNLGCATGTGDSGSIAAAVSASVLKFESAGVDRVVTASVPAVLFAATAESQGYHPDYLVTTEAPGSAIEPNVPADQAKNFHGYGYFPAVDVDTAHQIAPTAPEKKCLAMMKSQGLVPQGYNDYMLMYTTCDSLFLYDAALKADGGKTDFASVVGAINALGTSYQGVTANNASTSLSASQHDAITTYQDFDWSTGCSCFTYTGSPKPIPAS